jgi:hypothetical protein
VTGANDGRWPFRARGRTAEKFFCFFFWLVPPQDDIHNQLIIIDIYGSADIKPRAFLLDRTLAVPFGAKESIQNSVAHTPASQVDAILQPVFFKTSFAQHTALNQIGYVLAALIVMHFPDHVLAIEDFLHQIQLVVLLAQLTGLAGRHSIQTGRLPSLDLLRIQPFSEYLDMSVLKCCRLWF